jgi:hypothetical protein
VDILGLDMASTHMGRRTRATAPDPRDIDMSDKLNCFHISLVHKILTSNFTVGDRDVFRL